MVKSFINLLIRNQMADIIEAGSRDIVHTSTFWLKFGSLSPAVNLKNRSRSPKQNLPILYPCKSG